MKGIFFLGGGGGGGFSRLLFIYTFTLRAAPKPQMGLLTDVTNQCSDKCQWSARGVETKLYSNLRDWTSITGIGVLQNGRRGGGAKEVLFLPLQIGGRAW